VSAPLPERERRGPERESKRRRPNLPVVFSNETATPSFRPDRARRASVRRDARLGGLIRSRREARRAKTGGSSARGKARLAPRRYRYLFCVFTANRLCRA
jgi:hypothetical protein